LKLKLKNKNSVILAGIIILSALAYLPVMKGDFLADEYILILKNPLVQHPSSFSDFFLQKFWPGKVQDIYYRPLVILSYAFNWNLNKTAPLGYHLFNIIIHLANILLFYLLFRKWLPDQALLASAIFALHPVLTEAVGKISGRTDLLATFFIFLSWYLWIIVKDKAGFEKIVIYLTIAISFLLGLFSKETGTLFLFLAFLGDWYNKPVSETMLQILRKRIYAYALLLASLFVYLWLRQIALAGASVPNQSAFISAFPLWQKPMVICRIWLEYLRLLVFPYPLAPDYFYTLKFSPERYPVFLYAIATFLCFIAIPFIILGLMRKNVYARLAILWLVSLIPVSHIFPIPPALAERFLYLPSAFYAMAFATLIASLAKKYLKSLALSISALMTLFFIMTLKSAALYKNWELNYRDFVRKVPDEKIFHNLLGLNYLEKKFYDNAKIQFLWALRLDPHYPESMVNLALTEYLAGNPNSAIELLNKAIKQDPDYADAHFNLGKILANTGQLDQARKELETASRLDPQNPHPLFALAVIAEKQNEIFLAKNCLDKALRIASWHIPALKLRLKIAIREKDYATARELLQRWQTLAPDDPELKKIQTSINP